MKILTFLMITTAILTGCSASIGTPPTTTSTTYTTPAPVVRNTTYTTAPVAGSSTTVTKTTY